MKNRDKNKYRLWKRNWYLKNREHEIERKKKYRQTEKGKLVTQKSNLQAWVNSRSKILARQAVRRAIKSGKLVRKPCEVCGENVTDAHHEDYTKRLEVRWLCEKHHYELHRNARKTDDGVFSW